MRLLTMTLTFWAGLAGIAAADYVEFRSPTGNILCAIYSDKQTASARCDLLELTPSYTKRPASCEFDWGSSFGVDAKGKGYLACVSDAVGGSGSAVLRYGQSISLGGISCASAETGMTCTNAKGHGFSVTKAEQKVY